MEAAVNGLRVDLPAEHFVLHGRDAFHHANVIEENSQDTLALFSLVGVNGLRLAALGRRDPSPACRVRAVFAATPRLHYKGHLYLVFGTAGLYPRDAATAGGAGGAGMTLYVEASGGLAFARDPAQFAGTVDHEGRRVPRFASVG